MKSRKEIEGIRKYGFLVAESADNGGTGWFRCAPFYKTSVVWSFHDRHVSICPHDHVPSYDDMCRIKDMFYYDEDEVWQCHPKKSQYVNIAKNCLHLWEGRLLMPWEETKMKIMLDEKAIKPERAHELDAGYDLFLPEDVTVHRAQKSFTVDLGVHVEIPKGHVGFLKSKSGLNARLGITGEGVIDSGYTGSIVAKMYLNEQHDTISFKRGDKIIQLVILPIITPELVLADELEETDRGGKGFGSSGR